MFYKKNMQLSWCDILNTVPVSFKGTYTLRKHILGREASKILRLLTKDKEVGMFKKFHVNIFKIYNMTSSTVLTVKAGHSSSLLLFFVHFLLKL